ncbi:MAG: hypothetical protein JWM11_3571 [Planctomycetaceae bacterium]|nr:hypothetical protein [Planctomycetaceae bacterium]
MGGQKAPVGSAKVTTIPAPAGCQAVNAKIDAQGTIHLVSNSSDGPQYAKSTNGGKSFLKSIPILDRASRKPGLVFDVWDMAVSPDGHVHVALGTNAWKLKLPKDEWGFFYASLEPGASTFSPVRNLNHKPSEGFSLAVDDKGRVSACWLADKLYANVSLDQGKTFAPTTEIDPTLNPCNCCTTTATYGADGRLAVLYREETNNERDMFLALWDQTSNKVTRTRVSSTLWKLDSCPMSYYGIVPNGKGYVAVWPTEGKIYFARLDGQGVPQSPKEIKTAGITGMRTGMFTLNDTTGNTLVAWKKDGQLGWQLYDQQAKPVGRAGSVKSAGSGAAGIINKAGDFVLFQ